MRAAPTRTLLLLTQNLWLERLVRSVAEGLAYLVVCIPAGLEAIEGVGDQVSYDLLVVDSESLLLGPMLEAPGSSGRSVVLIDMGLLALLPAGWVVAAPNATSLSAVFSRTTERD